MLENSPQGNRNCQENKTSCGEPSLHMSLSAIFVQFPDSKGKCNAQNHKINRDHNRSQPAPKISAVKVTAGTTHVPTHCLNASFFINRDHNRSQPAPKISAVKVTAGTTHVPTHCLNASFFLGTSEQDFQNGRIGLFHGSFCSPLVVYSRNNLATNLRVCSETFVSSSRNSRQSSPTCSAVSQRTRTRGNLTFGTVTQSVAGSR